MSASTRAHRVGAEHFERVYQASSDPWDYCTSDYEREKYADTLAALPSRPIGSALELGCSIGVFTAQLAACCRHVTALDFAARAIELARERVGVLENVRLAQASFPEQVPAGPWDLVVCSEVLYYLGRPMLLEATGWLAQQLQLGASVVAVSWRGMGAEEPLRGDEVHDLLAIELSRWHTFDGRRSGYRLDRFDGA